MSLADNKGNVLVNVSAGGIGFKGTKKSTPFAASKVAEHIAQAAKAHGALTIGVVTRPFQFEGQERGKLAENGLIKLREAVDALIVIPNDRLLGIVAKDTPFLSAFAMCDEVLRHAVEGISDLITVPGIINVDFADVRAVMQNAGSALMGIGHGYGESRAEAAARAAISSPLLDVSINGARGVLFAVAGGSDLTMWEINEAAKIITSSIDPSAKVIFGAIQDDRIKKGNLKITVIASGFPDESGKPATLFSPSISQKNGFFTANKNGKEPPQDDDTEWDSIPAFIRRQKRQT